MTEARFDIQFAGELLNGTDADQVRVRLQQLFKLSDQDTARLFGGRPMIVKRGVDTATASRFRETFREAGALVRVVPAAGREASAGSANEAGAEPTGEATDSPPVVPAGLHLAPVGDARPLEAQSAVEPRTIDISHLSLIPGDDWTLEDCVPPLPPIELPDIRHLSILFPKEEDEDENRKTF